MGESQKSGPTFQFFPFPTIKVFGNNVRSRLTLHIPVKEHNKTGRKGAMQQKRGSESKRHPQKTENKQNESVLEETGSRMKTNTKRGRDNLSLLNTGALMMRVISKQKNGGSKIK